MIRSVDIDLQRVIEISRRVWVVASISVAAGSAAIFGVMGADGFLRLIQEGPYSLKELTLASVGIVWLAAGGMLWVLARPAFRARHGPITICTFWIVVMYVNVLRERTEYGDVSVYFRAAKNLADGEPLTAGYFYLPLWATILEPLVPLGLEYFAGLCWVLNVASLALLVPLLGACLERFGFGRMWAVALTFLFLSVNVPLLRTLGYVQVNLHVANLVLIALLSYSRAPLLSAAAIALATHLKVSPIVLVLPFLVDRQWRWLMWFAAAHAVLAGTTLVFHGASPFLDVYQNVQSMSDTYSMKYRDNSVNNFVGSLGSLAGLPSIWNSWLITSTKAFILSGVLATAILAVRNGTFLEENEERPIVENALPVMMIFMLLGSPLVWAHHMLFIGLPFLLVLKRLRTELEWVTFGCTYFLVYLVPTFDFFPWSFGRLLGPLLLLGLIFTVSRNPREDLALFRSEGLTGA